MTINLLTPLQTTQALVGVSSHEDVSLDDIFKIDDEYVVVRARANGSMITLGRGVLGSARAEHAQGAELEPFSIASGSAGTLAETLALGNDTGGVGIVSEQSGLDANVSAVATADSTNQADAFRHATSVDGNASADARADADGTGDADASIRSETDSGIASADSEASSGSGPASAQISVTSDSGGATAGMHATAVTSGSAAANTTAEVLAGIGNAEAKSTAIAVDGDAQTISTATTTGNGNADSSVLATSGGAGSATAVSMAQVSGGSGSADAHSEAIADGGGSASAHSDAQANGSGDAIVAATATSVDGDAEADVIATASGDGNASAQVAANVNGDGNAGSGISATHGSDTASVTVEASTGLATLTVDDGASTGAAGEALVSNGAGKTVWGPRGLTLLEQHTASASATLDFVTRNATGQSGATFQSDYDEYLIEFQDIVPVGASVLLALRCSTDGGATFDSGNNYSLAQLIFGFSGSALGGGAGGPSITLFPYSGRTMNTSAAIATTGSLKLHNPLSSVFHKRFEGDFNSSDNVTADPQRLSIVATYNVTTAVDALRFYASGGGATFSGTIRIYGVPK